MRNKRITMGTIIMACIILGCGCGSDPNAGSAQKVQTNVKEVSSKTEIEEVLEEVERQKYIPEASGELEAKSDDILIDYSNTSEGYVMAKRLHEETGRIKLQILGPTTTYTYNLTGTDWHTFPLSEGNGNYYVRACENVTGNKYAIVLSTEFSVELENEFAPFIRPNEYVDYAEAEKTLAKAEELAGDIEDPLAKVERVYSYVIENVTYDYDKAANVKSGYLPVLDETLDTKKGICFDYASLMTGMLRSQGVPSKLVIGYAGSVYHAWINVWTEEMGWVNGIIYFDGTEWHRMDPTFASSAEDDSIVNYIENGANYTEKYLY